MVLQKNSNTITIKKSTIKNVLVIAGAVLLGGCDAVGDFVPLYKDFSFGLAWSRLFGRL